MRCSRDDGCVLGSLALLQARRWYLHTRRAGTRSDRSRTYGHFFLPSRGGERRSAPRYDGGRADGGGAALAVVAFAVVVDGAAGTATAAGMMISRDLPPTGGGRPVVVKFGERTRAREPCRRRVTVVGRPDLAVNVDPVARARADQWESTSRRGICPRRRSGPVTANHGGGYTNRDDVLAPLRDARFSQAKANAAAENVWERSSRCGQPCRAYVTVERARCTDVSALCPPRCSLERIAAFRSQAR